MNRGLLSICFVFLCFLSPIPVSALTIPLDPGTPGSTFSSKTFDITSDLLGVVADGSSLDLDFEFTGKRHVEFDLEPTGVVLADSHMEGRLLIEWSAPVDVGDVNDPVTVPKTSENDGEGGGIL